MANLYEINNETQAQGGSLTGIKPDFELTSIAYGPSGEKADSAPGLVFTFERGKFKIKHVEYEIDPSRVRPNEKKNETQDEAVTRRGKEMATRIKHILSKFMDEKEVVLSGSNFQEFANNVAALAGNKYKGVKFRLKVVYNNKGYLSFPMFPKFIENMATTPKTELTITSFDKLEKPVPDAEGTTGAKTAVAGGKEEEF